MPVHKRDFASVHFAETSGALKAVKESEKYIIDGKLLSLMFYLPDNNKLLLVELLENRASLALLACKTISWQSLLILDPKYHLVIKECLITEQTKHRHFHASNGSS